MAAIRARYAGDSTEAVERTSLDESGREMKKAFVVTAVAAGRVGEKVGLKAGDVIVSYDGKPLTSVASFLESRKAEGAAGPPREMVVRRGDALLSLQIPADPLGVRLDERPARRKE
jgi:S1-C subfamily serine protease